MIRLDDNRVLLALAALIVALPLVLAGEKSSFTGTDDQASKMAGELAPGYARWAEPLWEPPNAEIASLLFALQAAIGAGVLGYVIGRRRGRAEADGRRARP